MGESLADLGARRERAHELAAQIPRGGRGWGAAGTTNCVWVLFSTRTRKRDGATIIEHLHGVYLLASEAEAARKRRGGDTEIFGIPFWGVGATALDAGLRATWPAQLVADLSLPYEQDWEEGFHL